MNTIKKGDPRGEVQEQKQIMKLSHLVKESPGHLLN